MMILKKPTFILIALSLVLTLVMAAPQSALAVPGECPEGYTQVSKWEWPDGSDPNGPPPSHEGATIVFTSYQGAPYDGQGPNAYVGHWDSGDIDIDFLVMTDGHEQGGGDAITYTYTFNPAVNAGNYDAYTYLLDSEGNPRAISNLVFCSDSFPITLAYLNVRANRGNAIVKWSTATEINTAGFLVYRSTTAGGSRVLVTPNLIAAQGSGITGASYWVTDTPGYGTFYYWLENVDYSGQNGLHGPVVVTLLPAIRQPVYRPSLPGQ